MRHTGYIASEGIPFILIPGVGMIIAFLAGLTWLAAVLFPLTLFVAWFFRNPERRQPEDPGQLASPADGKVIGIDQVTDGDRPGRQLAKISIFMNVFNVHVNRVPCSGEVVSLRYKPGRFLSANLDKASALNERNTVVIRTDGGQEVTVVQIAGLIARRIVCWVDVGAKVRRGERFGLIRFGSRVELFLPAGSTLLVKKGDKVRAGETPIGELP